MDNQELPKIELETYTIPAVAEKVFNQMWVTDFVVKGDDVSNVSLYAILRPFCPSTGEIMIKAGTEKIVNLTDLFAILQGNKIEPKLTPETITKGGQLMAMALDFLKSVVIDKMQPEPIIPTE